MGPQFLRIEKAAKLIDVSPWTIRKWIKDGSLRSHRFGRAVRIKETDLMDFALISPEKPEFIK